MNRSFAIAALAMVNACSYGASFADCEVVCHASDDCPSGFACGGEGLCRPTGVGDSCARLLGDASQPPNGDGGSDGGKARCVGTATACATLQSASECNAQSGCSFAPLSCTLTTNCSQFMTNQACVAAPGCATDFTTSTCKKIAGYCAGSTQQTCEDTTDCVFGGGCGGTPNACGTRSSETACKASAGCSWQ